MNSLKLMVTRPSFGSPSGCLPPSVFHGLRSVICLLVISIECTEYQWKFTTFSVDTVPWKLVDLYAPGLVSTQTALLALSAVLMIGKSDSEKPFSPPS